MTLYLQNKNMPFIRVWIHYVWATKNRAPVLTKPIRTVLFEHILRNARDKGIYLDRVNGHLQHVHCLISLGSGQLIDKTAQLLKGEATHWFNNKSGLGAEKLEWQDDYFAVSIGESGLKNVQVYIDNQEAHHARKTFAQEYDELMAKYGFTQ